MDTCQFQCAEEQIQFQKSRTPLFQNASSSIFNGIFNECEVIIKYSSEILDCSEDPKREFKMLDIINKKSPSERIFMKLLVHLQTEKEHIFILEKAKIDLFTFLDKHGSQLTICESISIIHKLAKITNRLHELGFTHCDISLENIVIYGKDNIAFIDAAQVQQPDFNSQFHVNVPNKPHEFDNKHPGKSEYELPEANYGEPFNLRRADVFAISIVMWTILVGKRPFVIDTRNPKNITAYEDRNRFVNCEYDQLISKSRLQKIQLIWPAFCDFLATSKFQFDFQHALFS